MFTTILLLAVTAGGEAADFGRRGGCNGCSGGCFGGCSGGKSGGLFGGGGLFGRKNNGCNGCSGVVYNGCSASYGCSGVVHGGGCSGVVYGGGCTGGVVYSGGCSGVVTGGCTGVIVHSGCCGGTVVVPSGTKKIEGTEKKPDGKKIEKKPDGGKKIEGGTTTKPGELTATEAKWLKEMMDAEKDPAKKKEIEKEFKDEKTGAGREAIYKLWKKDTGKGGDA